MLSQLEFKLSVEKQYEEGIKKIMASYNMEGDRKVRAEAQGKRAESLQKIQLLQRALKRYEDLHVDMESAADPADGERVIHGRNVMIADSLASDDSVNGPSLRKSLTGLLALRIHAISDVTHASTGRLTRGPETYVSMKVEDDFKGRTRSTRTDRWTDEVHEIDIDKGNEIELTVYDKTGSEQPVPIGMLWIRISDIAEEIRRKKIESEFNSSGWVSADRTVEDGQPSRPDLQFNPPPGQKSGTANSATALSAGIHPQNGPVVIDSWFSLEPVGRIQLTLSFGKSNVLETYSELTIMQQNRRGNADLLMEPDSGARAPSANGKKTSMSFMATSSWRSSSTTSCVALFAENFSSTPLGCSARIANTSVMKSVIRLSSRSASASQMQRVIRMRRSSITAYHIDLRFMVTLGQIGVVIVGTCYPWAGKMPRGAKVRISIAVECWISGLTPEFRM